MLTLRLNFRFEITKGGVENTRLEAKDTKKSEAKDTHFEERLSRFRRTKEITRKSSCKKKVFAQKFANFPQNLGDLHKKKKFSIENSQVLWRAAHDLGKFSASHKIVLSMSRRQGIFEDLQASWPRSRTSNCVLEDSTSGNHRASYHMVHVKRNVRVTYANRTLLLNIKFLAKLNHT